MELGVRGTFGMKTEWGRQPARDRPGDDAAPAGPKRSPPPDRRTARSGASFYWLAGGAVAVVAYFFVPEHGQVLAYDAIGLASVAAMFAGLKRNGAEPRPAWALLCFGVLTMVGGDIAYGITERIPSVADMLYVSGYAVIGIGLIELVRRGAPERDRSGLVDGAAIATAGLVASLLFLGIAHSEDISALGRAVAISYPLMDLILFGMVVRVALTSQGFPICYRFLGVGFLLMMVADVGYMLQQFGTGYSAGSALDTGWLLSYAFFGAALLHPSIASIEARAAAPSRTRSSRGYQSYTPTGAAVQALRMRRVLGSTGLMALGVGALALLAGVGWRASEVILLAGMYGTTGALMVIGSALSSM
jgi:hypothetical protein